MKRLLLIALLLISSIIYAQNNYKEVTLLQLAQRASKEDKGYVILDVRTPGEYMDTLTGGRRAGIGRIKTAINVSLQDLLNKPETIHQLDGYKNEEVYVICSHSYRSRRISNLLLQNGFTSVNNVKGGMTEWYRNYDELQPYMPALYENNIAYHNLAPAELFRWFSRNEPVELIGLSSPPRFFFDSLVAPYYPIFPDLKDATYFKFADSLQLLEKVKGATGKRIVIFNTVGGGTQDISEWLARKGYNNIYNLQGSLGGYFEYVVNFQPKSNEHHLVPKSGVRFFTPLSYCSNMPKNTQWIDLRHDTSFTQLTHGTKLDYRTIKDAAGFYYLKTADEFSAQFPDKTKFYMFLPMDGYRGAELAAELLKKGYRIGWIIGGLERWEWYSNNIEAFMCRDYFVN